MGTFRNPDGVTGLQMSSKHHEQMETVTYIASELYNAAAEGKFQKLEGYAALDLFATPNKNTILHIHLTSPRKRSTEFVTKVIQRCPSLLWKTNDNGDTPLHVAARYGHSDVAKLLIQLAKAPWEKDLESGVGAAAEARRMIRMLNKQKDTALHEAARCGSVDVIGDILAAEDLEFTYSANDSGETPLYLAVDCGNNRTVHKILDTYKNQSVAYGGPNGKTALHAAVMQIDTGAVDKLLERMDNLANEVDENGWTPLHYAAYEDHHEQLLTIIVGSLLNKDKTVAYVKDKYWQRTALHVAACRGNAHIMGRIISLCPDCCELTDIRGWNVLHYAAINKGDKALKTVLEDPSLIYLADGKDTKGNTPIHLLYASRSSLYFLRNIGGADVGQILMDKGYDAIYHYEDKSQNKEEILEWTKDLGSGPFGKMVVGEDWRETERTMLEKAIPELEKAKDSHLVAAVLVATVTFAAAFTLPGGYVSIEDETEAQPAGTPILSRNTAFDAFMITDAIAMVLSTSSVFIHFIMVMLGYKRKYNWLIRSGLWFIVFAMGAMVLAFVTGTYAVLATKSPAVAIATCVIGLGFFIYVFYATLRLVAGHVKLDQAENKDRTLLQSLFFVWFQNPFPLFSCGGLIATAEDIFG